VRTPISRGVASDPPKVRPPPRQRRAGSQQRSPRTFFGSRRTPRNILGDTSWLAAPTEEGAAEPSSAPEGHLGTSSAMPFGWQREPREDAHEPWSDQDGHLGTSSAIPFGWHRPPREVRTNLRRVETDTSAHPRRHRSVGRANRGGCARTLAGSRRTPRYILGDTVRLAPPTEGGAHEPSSDRDGHLGTSSAIPFGWQRQPRRVRTNLGRIKTDTSARPRRYRSVGGGNRRGCGATLAGARHSPPRGAATPREIGRHRARVTRHPRRDRVPTRPVRRPTRRWRLRHREVLQPTLRRVAHLLDGSLAYPHAVALLTGEGSQRPPSGRCPSPRERRAPLGGLPSTSPRGLAEPLGFEAIKRIVRVLPDKLTRRPVYTVEGDEAEACGPRRGLSRSL
jgi:hypothetical protein